MLSKVQSWNFDAFLLSEDDIFGAILAIFEDLKIFEHFNIDRGNLTKEN